MNLLPAIELFSTPHWKDYELLDSGNGLKLERFGHYKFIRPEHQAVWQPALSTNNWEDVDAVFQPTSEESGGKWKYKKHVESEWVMHYKDLTFLARTSNSRHLGVFPEQAPHWDWIIKSISSVQKPVNVLNLFGYTGVASLASAIAGASVTHLDASKKSVQHAKENQRLSGLLLKLWQERRAAYHRRSW